jgi:hypothetical protein
VSVKGRPLYCILGKSQTYYFEHILVYGCREGLLLPCHGFRLFSDRLIRGGDGGGLSTTLSPGLRSGDLDPMIGEWWVGPACAWGTSGVCVLGYPAGHIDSRIAGRSGTTCLQSSTVVRTER